MTQLGWMEGNFGDAPLHVAATRGALNEVEPLLAAGADLNAKGELDYTPLHNAALQGHIEVVKKLLACGVSTEATNVNGDTAKDVAARMKYQDIVSIFNALKTNS